MGFAVEALGAHNVFDFGCLVLHDDLSSLCLLDFFDSLDKPSYYKKETRLINRVAVLRFGRLARAAHGDAAGVKRFTVKVFRFYNVLYLGCLILHFLIPSLLLTHKFVGCLMKIVLARAKRSLL